MTIATFNHLTALIWFFAMPWSNLGYKNYNIPAIRAPKTQLITSLELRKIIQEQNTKHKAI